MRTPKVALLVETARGYGRELLRGIVRYARLHGPWGFYVTPGDFEQVLPRMRRWRGTGIIARIETPNVARAILRAGLPTIALDLSREQLRRKCPLSRLSEVASDSHHAARLAAEHLLDLGFRHFAFVGLPGRIWSERREDSFCSRIRSAGFEPRVYRPAGRSRNRTWEREQDLLARWLGELPRPIGLMACNDDRGREVLEACRTARIQVPDEISVIGVDNDELLCELADPPLSSVALNAEGAGYRAAALLDKMMRGRIRRPRRLVVEPLRVVTRRSTDIVALADGDVARAVRFIRDHASRPIGIPDVVEHLQISRRALEVRFRREMGRTVHEEIQRVRLEKARSLLQESDLPIPRVAASAGYGSASYLSQVFRRELGVTPAKYRARIREG